jgi:SAM-dependent methyltransferase
VSEAQEHRRYGQVFDGVAEQYDRVRPTYPPELIDAAFRAAELAAGDEVLEVGCGTGQLTAALIGRGLRVHAIEPGANMARFARRRVGESAPAEFQIARFEEALVPEGRFAAVFSATAFHWVDPDVSWARAAQSLRPGGTLALLQYCAVRDERTIADEEALLGALTRIVPEIASTLPHPRDAETILTGALERATNLSEVWSWIANHELAVADAAPLFEDVQVVGVPSFREETAETLIAHFRTTSLRYRVPADRRSALEEETRDVIAQLGGKVRQSDLAIVATGRRTAAGS